MKCVMKSFQLKILVLLVNRFLQQHWNHPSYHVMVPNICLHLWMNSFTIDEKGKKIKQHIISELYNPKYLAKSNTKNLHKWLYN
jgi:hypothetical protein